MTTPQDPQRLTFVSARQEWKRHCKVMEERYRKEHSMLESRKRKELSAISVPRYMPDNNRKLEMEKVTADYDRRIAELEARHHQEAENYVRSLAYTKSHKDQERSSTSDSRFSDESKGEFEAKAMDTHHFDIKLAKMEIKATEELRRWELHGNAVRSVPLHTSTSESSNQKLGTSDSKRKADEEINPYPKRQRTDSAFAEQVSEIKTIMYADVRKNAVDHNHWDTIIEWPEQSKQFWVCFCEQHNIHFKQKADNAAAKHLSGLSHGLTRDRRQAMILLGYYIPDCTEELRTLHNAEVNEKYTAGYVPCNEYKREARWNHQHTLGSNRSPQKPNQPALSSVNPFASSSSDLITHPKTSHVYYAKYEGKYWAVVILGWDKLPDGCRHSTLAASELIKHDPPSCYEYDGYKRIAGWKPNYADGGKSVSKREFPVMYFDEELNYGWVPAKDLSKLDLNAATAPKRKGFPEKSYNDARDWVAQRCGYKTWNELNKSTKGLRVMSSADYQPKPPVSKRVAHRDDAPQSRENSEERRASHPSDVVSGSERDTNFAEKGDPDKRPLHLMTFEESLERLPSDREAFRHTLTSGIKNRSNPSQEQAASTAHTPSNSHSAISTTPALAPNPTPEQAAAPAVLAAPVLAPPAIPPAASASSPQIPTPQTPTQAQVSTIGGGQTPPSEFYEISAYEHQISEDGQVRSQLIWERGSRSEPCVKLIISPDRRTARAQGGPFDLMINPLDCLQVRLKTPMGNDGLISEHGICYVTLPQVSGGPAIKMTFDRSDDKDGTMGNRRVRLFVRWLWEQNPNMKS